MTDRADRARDLLPTVVITVLSMIQALALELYWSRFRESDYLWQGGWDAALGWLQLAVMLLGILQIWLFYVSLVLRFSWLPTMEDTLTPFAIGLFEFSLIDLMGPGTVGQWFLALAGVFFVSVGASHMVLRRARHDPGNAEYFDKVAPASWRDYVISATAVFSLAGFGVALLLSDENRIIALMALLFALLALSRQLYVLHYYWLILPEPGAKERGKRPSF